MIVILNTLDIPLSARLAEMLASRYGERDTFLDLHAPKDSSFPISLDDMVRLISPENARQRVAAKKQAGYANLVVKGTFTSPQNLRNLRIDLSGYDDEVYAFRLPLSQSVLSHIAVASKDLVSVHSQWVKALDAGAGYGDMGYEIVIESSDPADTANHIWDDVHAPVELVEYQTRWPEMFATEKAQILHTFRGKPVSTKILSLEHIGSTAIPGMQAKPVIDILITVENLDDAIPCIQPLRELGYAFIDYPQNTDRRFFRKGTPRSHHIHIVIHDSPSAQAYLRFRDALRSNADLRQEYQELKQESMQHFKHRRALYGERKGALIRKVLTQS